MSAAAESAAQDDARGRGERADRTDGAELIAGERQAAGSRVGALDAARG